MAQRTPVPTIPLNAQLQPQARPIDTYIKPSPDNSMSDLARSLRTVSGSLDGFLSIRDQKAEEEDFLRGQAAFYTDHEGEFAQAVNSGTIPAQYSPFYVRGFKNAQGSAYSDTLRAKWNDAWDSWDGKDLEDPQAFDQFFQGFLQENLSGFDDPQVLKGILPGVQALQQNAYSQYLQYRHGATVEGSLTANSAVIAGAVQDGVDEGLVAVDENGNPVGANYQQIFEKVNATVAESLKTGDPGGKAVDTFIDAMAQKIIGTRDPKLLDWFDTKVPGKDYTYGETPHGLAVKNQTIDKLESEARQQAAGMSAAERQQMEKLKDEAQTGIIKSIIEGQEVPEELIRQAEKNGDPLARLHVREWSKTLQGGVSDPQRLKAFYDKVISGSTRPELALQHALTNGVFANAEDLRAASSFVQSYKDVESTVEKALGGQAARTLVSAMRERTSMTDPLGLNPLSGTTNEGFEAITDFRQLVTQWIMQNPQATEYEIETQLTKYGRDILKNIVAPADPFSETPAYNRPAENTFANPFANDVRGEPLTDEQQAKATEAEGQDGADYISDDENVLAWEKQVGLTPQRRAAIMKAAKANGMTYEELIYLRAINGQQQGQPQEDNN